MSKAFQEGLISNLNIKVTYKPTLQSKTIVEKPPNAKSGFLNGEANAKSGDADLLAPARKGVIRLPNSNMLLLAAM